MTPDDSSTDEDLIAAINAGDYSAFDKLYYRYRDWVASLSLRFTANHEDAMDATQETFVYLAKKFPRFTLTAKMTTFLYPVVKHLSLAARRRTRRMINDDLLLSQAAAHPPGSQDSDRADLASVMSSLPETQREVVLMRFVDSFTLEEIATALNIPTGTVKSRLHIALGALKENPRVQKYFERQDNT